MTKQLLSPERGSEKKFIRSFFIRAVVLLAVVTALVVFFDPFFHYHKPWAGLKAVLTDKEYQCIGSLRNFDYDSLIVGSSVCENYNNGWFDEGFSCTAIKAIRAYGATGDLCWFLDEAFADHDLTYVFYNIDPASLSADPVTTFDATGCPMYLYDKNPLNDWKYLWNKDVLFEKIPYMAAYSFLIDYDEGDSYNWAQWKEFRADIAMSNYSRLSATADMMDETVYAENLAGNIELLTSEVEAHPDTQFLFFLSPYSMLWWDNIYRTGERDAYLYDEEQTIAALLPYENVEIYYFQDLEDIILDLDNYMDTLHFSKDINYLLYEQLVSGENRLYEDTYEERLNHMRALSDEIVTEEILEYYPEL